MMKGLVASVVVCVGACLAGTAFLHLWSFDTTLPHQVDAFFRGGGLAGQPGATMPPRCVIGGVRIIN